jgi:competence protein ComEC
LDAAGERALRRTYDLPRADVLVAGHHGADTSTSQEWLDALQPSAALISVGENGYGHPGPGTLNRLALQDVRVYRTDRLGSVTVRVMSMDN